MCILVFTLIMQCERMDQYNDGMLFLVIVTLHQLFISDRKKYIQMKRNMAIAHYTNEKYNNNSIVPCLNKPLLTLKRQVLCSLQKSGWQLCLSTAHCQWFYKNQFIGININEWLRPLAQDIDNLWLWIGKSYIIYMKSSKDSSRSITPFFLQWQYSITQNAVYMFHRDCISCLSKNKQVIFCKWNRQQHREWGHVY